MNLKEWRAGRETEKTLPSGLVVRVKKVEMVDLVMQGMIPAPLLGMVEELSGKEMKTVPVSDFPRYSELIDVVVRAMVVAPPIAAEADAEHLAIGEIPFTDRLFLFTEASGEAASLAPFLAQPAGGANAAPAGEPVSPAAQPDRGDTGAVGGLPV